jgi:hypothetical protein
MKDLWLAIGISIVITIMAGVGLFVTLFVEGRVWEHEYISVSR